MGRVHSRVDPPAPGNRALVIRGRQLEVKWLPVGIQDHVKHDVLVYGLQGECQAVGGVAPVGLPELNTVPGSLRSPEELVQSEAFKIRLLTYPLPSCAEQR